MFSFRIKLFFIIEIIIISIMKLDQVQNTILRILFLSTFLIVFTYTFDFREISSSCSPTTINTPATYLFSYFRTFDNYGTETSWNTQAVITTATVRLIFPSDYTLSGSETCNSVTVDSQLISGATCSISGNTITVNNVFSTLTGAALFVQQIDLQIGQVNNPSPALTTGQFSGYIGTDRSVPFGSGITLTAGSFNSCKITFNPSTVRTSGSMVLTLDPTNSIPVTDGSIKVNFPISRIWSQQIVTSNTINIAGVTCSAVTTNVIAPTCVGSVSAATVILSNFLSANISDSFSVAINNLASPPTTQPADFLNITSYNGIYQLDKCYISISDLVAKGFTALSISPITTMTVNSNVGLRFLFTLADIIDQKDYFQITFPTGLTIVVVNATSTNPNLNAPSKSGQVITITQRTTIARQYSQGSSFFINFYNFTAPPSTKVTDAITVTILRNNFAKMSGSATLQAVASTLSGSVSPKISTVSTNTSYLFTIITNDALSSTGVIKINFPTQLSLSISSASCAVLSGTGVNNLPTCTVNDIDKSITLSSINGSSSTISAQTMTINISGIINAESIKPTDSFTINSYYQSAADTLVATGTIGGVTASLGIISASSVTVISTSYTCLDTSVTYTISFVNTYKIPANGYIQLTIPNKITVVIGSVGSYCKFAVNGSSFNGAVCTGTTEATQYRVKFNGVANTAIAAGSTIALQIASIITNPSSTAIISSFGIYTYAYDGSNGYGIESLTTGITIQMTIPATFNSRLVERASNQNSITTSYTFKLTQRASLQTGAYLIINFPSIIEVTALATCTDLNSNALSCSISTSQVIAQLVSPVSSLTQFGIIVTNIINPPSFKPLNQAFIFLTKTSDDISKYAQSSFLTALSNNVPSVFSSISGTFSPRTYGSTLTLTISLNPSSRIVPTKLTVSLASSFSVSSAICSSFVGFAGSCTSNSYTVQVTGTLVSSIMSFSIQGITAPTDAVTDYTIVSSYDSSNYKIDDSTTDIIFSIICTLPCRTCTTGVPTQCLTCYNSTITTFIYYYSTNKQCLQQCPSTTYKQNTLFRCLACDTICLECNGISTNCTSCLSSSSYPYLNVTSTFSGTCLSACPTYYYPDSTQSPTKCVLCQSPCSTCTSKIICKSCLSNFYYNGTDCVSTCPSGTYIQNTNTWTCDPCSSVCATCQITVDNCTSCSATAALHNNNCVSVCPSPLVINNGVCASCDTSCKTCSISSTNCTSCDSSTTLYKYLYDNKCLSTCPQTYYIDSVNAICKLCSALTSLNCANCSSSSTCLTCDSGYVLFTSSCLANAPVGYIDINGVAVACTGDCQTCSMLVGNCTSCVTNNLQGNNCVSTCSAGSVPINQICTTCQVPCKTCSITLTNCTACLPNQVPQVYLSNYDCVSTCPTFTYPDNNTNVCQNCITPCERCSSSTECTSCLTTFFLFGTDCKTTCPFGYVGIGRICQACAGNCQSCENSTTSCLTCDNGTYYLSTTKTCEQICPTGLYPNTISGSCTGCSGDCATCENTSSTCLTCSTLNLYNNTCISTCPDGTYALNSVCQTCNSSCQKCTSASVCTSCQYNYYLYQTFCVNPCPTNFPVISSTSTCTACSDSNCVTCNSSDYCSSCIYPNLLFFGTCVSSCPTNYTANDTSCNFNPVTNTTNTTNTNSTVNQTLSSTLSSSSSTIVPVPFFIGGILVSVAAILSKLQYSPTFLFGALFSIWALLQWGSLVCALLLTYFYDQITDYKFYILGGAFIGIYILNIFALLIQNCYLRFDVLFSKWLDTKLNLLSYITNSLISLLINHKFKNLLFCKLFNFEFFKAPLQSTQSFRIFNVFAFLHFLPAAASITACTLYIIQKPLINQPLMAYIDLIALSLSGIILAFLNAFKGDDFFFEVTDEGYVMNKRIVQSQSIIQQAILPQTHQDQQCYNPPTQTPFKKHYNFTPSDVSVSSIDLYKNYHNISIQAEEIIEKSFQQSMIDHMSHNQSVPDINYFEKHDVSAQYDISRKFQDKSISMQPIKQQEISIQFSPRQQSISIQNSVIQQNDISLQNVPNVQENHVQANVEVHDISAQYSQKPVFENIQEDFLSETDQNIDINQSATKSAVPVKQQPKLRPELELDIDQKLKKRQQQLETLQQQNRKLQIEIARKKFEDKYSPSRQRQQVKKQQFSEIANKQKLNQMFNNQSIRDDSSLMDSKEDLLKGKKNKGNNYRVQTVKSQEQFLDLLDNKEDRKIQQKSISLNMSNGDQLPEQQYEPPKNNIIFQQEDKQRLDQQQEQQIQQPTSVLKTEDVQNIIKGDSTDQYLPSFDKSNSTNFISIRKDRTGRPPLKKGNNNLDSSLDKSGLEEEEQIIRHPIRSKYDKQILKNSRQEDIDHETRNNLNDFLSRKNKNPFSAHPSFKKEKYQDRNYSRQNPLPQMDRLQSQQSMGRLQKKSQDSYYRSDNRKPSFDKFGNQKLENFQFYEDQRIEIIPTQQNRRGLDDDRKLPRIGASQKRFNSTSKYKNSEKPVQRELLNSNSAKKLTELDRYLEKQQKKATNVRNQMQTMQYMLSRPDNSNEKNKGYMRQTYTSEEKKKNFQKIYLNKPKRYE